MQCIIPIEFKKKCVQLSKSGMPTRKIYTDVYCKQYGNASLKSFARLLRKWKNKVEADDKLLESGNLSYNFTPNASTVQVNSKGDVVQAWIKTKSNDDLILQLIDTIKANTPYRHIYPAKHTNVFDMLEINQCDMHFGIADLDFYMSTLSKTLDIITRKTYEKIYVIIGQDLFHNDNFNGTTTKGTQIQKVDMVKAWNDAKTYFCNIIDNAVLHSNSVELIYVPGNHDQCFCWTFFQMLKEIYKDLKSDDRLSERKCITYGTNFIGLTHGEFKHSNPSDLRSQFSVKFPIQFANSKVKEIHCSHLHSEKEKDEYGVMCRRLSSGNKEDDWSDKEGYIGANKRFMLFEWSLEDLIAIYYV